MTYQQQQLISDFMVISDGVASGLCGKINYSEIDNFKSDVVQFVRDAGIIEISEWKNWIAVYKSFIKSDEGKRLQNINNWTFNLKGI